MFELIFDDIDFGGDDLEMEVVEDPTPEELAAFWAWVATLNPDPEIPF